MRAHLVNHGSITPVIAEAIYKCRDVSKRVSELRHDHDVKIARTLLKDATGQRYASYTMLDSERRKFAHLQKH